MKKTAAQLEKRKRDLEKRKKLEKVILKLASELPDEAQVTPAPKPLTAPIDPSRTS